MSNPMDQPKPNFKGRGSSLNLHNRFETIRVEADFQHLDEEDQLAALSRKITTQFFTDDSGSVVSENKSEDVDFKYSLNPYRGCVHGCSYCYARPTHEFLGLNAGIDFESQIFVKPKAPQLFRKWLSRPKWKSNLDTVMLSGVTDCYQPCERKFELTRRCLEVALEFRQPMRITTKNALIKRDLDLLSELAKQNLIQVTMSLASLDQSLIRVMEPRSSSPAARLNAIEKLAAIGVPVKTLVAPLIPGINENEIPAILEAVSGAGAQYAGYTVLRLPTSVEPVFFDWVERNFPDRIDKIKSRLMSLGGGKIYDATIGKRMKGQGIWAEQLGGLFATYCNKLQLKRGIPLLEKKLFRVPTDESGHQLELF